MKKYHVASFSARSGIAKYALDFYELILADRSYIQLDIRDIDKVEQSMSKDDRVHFEIGINSIDEINLLYRLLNRGFRNIDITIHDPPFLCWPYFKFKRQFINSVSKFFHLYLKNFGIGESVFRHVRRFYVLTHSGCDAMRNRYRHDNVRYIPFILRPNEINKPSIADNNLLFFGFIGKNKGLDYALSLHAALLEDYPECRFIVLGGASSQEDKEYLAKVKAQYGQNVDYLGFVDESRLTESFGKASIVVLPFSPYRSVTPASASVLGAMKMGKVVCATDVNAVAEYIRDGETGYLLQGEPVSDVELLRQIMKDRARMNEVAEAAVMLLKSEHNPTVVGEFFDVAVN